MTISHAKPESRIIGANGFFCDNASFRADGRLDVGGLLPGAVFVARGHTLVLTCIAYVETTGYGPLPIQTRVVVDGHESERKRSILEPTPPVQPTLIIAGMQIPHGRRSVAVEIRPKGGAWIRAAAIEIVSGV